MEQATAPKQLAQLTKLARGREAEIFAWEDGTVLKLYFDTNAGQGAAHEAAAMSAAKDAGGPAPAALGTTSIEGRPGLIIERVDGIDLLTQFGRKPWSIVAGGRTIGRLHAALHRVTAPPTLPTLREGLTRGIMHPSLVPPELRDAALRALETLPDRDRLLHGDFHPGNVIVAPSGSVVIDWPNATRGDPAADVARTLLMFRLATLPPGQGSLMRALNGFGRVVVRRGYVAAYRAARPDADPRDVDRWMLPVAVHRLSEDIPTERAQLFAYIARLRQARGAT